MPLRGKHPLHYRGEGGGVGGPELFQALYSLRTLWNQAEGSFRELGDATGCPTEGWLAGQDFSRAPEVSLVQFLPRAQ